MLLHVLKFKHALPSFTCFVFFQVILYTSKGATFFFILEVSIYKVVKYMQVLTAAFIL